MAGYSEDIECPHCGWESAQYNHESRGEYRGETRQCYICGWDEYNWANLWDEEDEDAPKEYKDIPDDEIIPLAKIIIPFVDYTYTIDDDAFLDNIVWSGLLPKLLKEENWHKLIDVMFGNYEITID